MIDQVQLHPSAILSMRLATFFTGTPIMFTYCFPLSLRNPLSRVWKLNDSTSSSALALTRIPSEPIIRFVFEKHEVTVRKETALIMAIRETKSPPGEYMVTFSLLDAQTAEDMTPHISAPSKEILISERGIIPCCFDAKIIIERCGHYVLQAYMLSRADFTVLEVSRIEVSVWDPQDRRT